MTKRRRLQVLIEDQQWARLESAAAARGVSVAAVVRHAIDVAVPGGSQTRARSAQAILDADTMEVPDADDLRRELDAVRRDGGRFRATAGGGQDSAVATYTVLADSPRV